MKIKKGLTCVDCELHHWDFDSEGNKYPISYVLHCKFHKTDVFAVIHTSELQSISEFVKFEYVNTNSDLLASFEDVFLVNDLKDVIRSICRKCWNSELDSIVYDYLGFKT